jgi:nitroreductase
MIDPQLQSIWDERYREGEPAWNGPIPEAIEVLLRHRSVREFDDRPLPENLLELLAAAAQSAPTSSNKQFWSAIAVQDPARKQRLAELSAKQEMVAKAPLLLVWLADLSRIAAIGEREQVALEGLDFLESFLVASLDAAFAAQNTVVAAEALGLGTVYVGAMRDHPEAVAAELKLPPMCVALFGMCIGHPATANAATIKPRLPQQALIHRETYGTDGVEDAVDRHDGHYAAFRQEQGMSEALWSQHIMSRVRSARALQGREHLRETLHRMGFRLK